MDLWKKGGLLSVALLLLAAASGFPPLKDVQAADYAQINAPAPDFTLSDLEGKEVSLSGLKGKVIVLTFWSIWCNPCRQELPVLDALDKRYQERGLKVIGVTIDRDSVGSIQEFVTKHDLCFPILLDRERKAMKAYRAHFLPTTFVLNREGVVVDKKVGIHNWMSPESQSSIEGLLKKK
ncbi:MAG: TlpA disulfide reductase family protein [bacterium]|jgi:peroxiredoxin